MSRLFDKSIRVLELPQVLEKLSEQAVSNEAKDRALHLRPATEREKVLELQDQTDAARRLIGLRGSPSFSGVKPVAKSLERADRGGGLNTRELLTIADLLTCARRTRDYFYNDEGGEKTVLDSLFASLHGNRFLEEKIKKSIVDEDTLADSASSTLTDIRRHMRIAQTKSRQILQRVISSPSYSKILQETIITQRDGRFVVPVKAEHRGDMPGLVHDISSSGATLFVEPMGVVQANNELIELEAKEKKEIERILAELSAEAADHKEDIQLDYETLVSLDLIFARGELSYKMNAERPEIRRDGAVILRRARHPLLDPEKAVPIDISLGDTFDTLVITGPNTGGKTVSLKTLGLLCLMAQCGLHIPAASGSAVPVFDRVLADVGDEQSIEQSLSTFSAHMTNIVHILQEADNRSLVLFDELGAGTDPVEGAALAIAIIQRVRRSGAKLAATTHYAELKTFAMTTAGVENASCEFNVETLRPTYRLLIGIPGKSNAFAISKRLGLSDDVIEDAKRQMTGESVRFEDVLTQLESKRQALDKKQTEIDRLYLRREEDARKAREFRTQMEKAKENARSHGEAEARRILRDARAAVDQIYSELSELRRRQEKAEQVEDMNEVRTDLGRKLNEAESAVGIHNTAPEPVPAASRPVQAGDQVEIPGVRIPADVVAVNKDGTLQLVAGRMKMTVRPDEVRLIEGPEKRKTGKTSVRQYTSRILRSAAPSELDIRGMETLEAESVVENFIDSAVMGKLETVTIIHGKGTGALRKKVHEILKRNHQVKGFRLGVYGEGEDGVTIVTLK